MAASVAEPSCEVDKLSYEIFSILESKFLFGLTEKVAGETPAAGERLGRGKVRVLCIDGGSGPGGVVSAKALAYLEAALGRKSGNPDARIADYVDVAAGSGIGGLLASMLFTRSGDSSRPLFHAENTWKLLVDSARDLFPRRSGMFRRLCSRSPGSRFDRVLKNLFGDSTLRDTLKPVLVPCYDLSSSAPFLFSRADAMETDGYNFRIRDVCRAAAADPALGRPIELRSLDGRTRCVGVDGGIVMNNPTAAAITHVLNNKQEFPFVAGVEDLIVLSLGAGDSTSDYDTCNQNPAPRASQLIKIAGDGVSDLVDQAVSMAFGFNRATNYVRVQPNGLGGAKLSGDPAATPANMKMVASLADEVLAQRNVESVLFRGRKVTERTNAEALEWFADELVKEQERRRSRAFPTVVLKQHSPRTSSATSR
ncbi:Patatin-like protein 7 [Nymphaea thermarum]|nr:Patatin-like protein 7 [Nymphaea thermarum]